MFVSANAIPVVEAGKDETKLVLDTVTKLVAKGIVIVKANGNGQKPADIATQVRQDYGHKLSPKRVRDILSKAERDGILIYNSRAAGSHGKAGYSLNK
jgi:hypothetical protein